MDINQKENIDFAVDECNKHNDCEECIRENTGMKGNTIYVPCNFVKILYDEDLCDYI